MTKPEALPQHLQICDEFYQLALEDNRQLKEHGRVPAPAFLERKRTLLTRLEQSLAELRTCPAAAADQRHLVEKIRGRILQILELDKENERLLLRASLSRGLGAPVVPAAAPAQLQKIYAQAGA
jgi:hypothetical protein